MALAITLATTFTPVNAIAAKSNMGRVVMASSGNVYSVLYPGGKAKKARFSVEYYLKDDTTSDNEENFVEYKSYEVTVRINRSHLTKSEIIKAVNEMKRKDVTFNDYTPLIIDNEGDRAINLAITGGFRADLSSAPKKQVAKTKKYNYSFNNWRKQSVYRYRLVVPADHESVYVGVAGLRNGFPSKAAYRDFKNNRINFYNAGYGSANKKGYAFVTKVHKQSK